MRTRNRTNKRRVGKRARNTPNRAHNIFVLEQRVFVISQFIYLCLLIAIDAWCLHIIFRFYHYLKDRETSFNFTIENDFQLND